MKNELLRVEALRKKLEHDYLKHINFNLFDNEILGIITRSSQQRKALFNILTGGLRPDGGRIFIHDCLVDLSSKSVANRMGIYGISCGSSLIFNMSIAENIFIDRSHISNLQIMNRKVMINEANDILEKARLKHISSHTPVKRLTPAMRSSIEVLKAVLNNARLLVIDDISVNFTDRETEDFKTLLKYVILKGTGIIFISKRLNRLFDIANRGVIICEGMTVDILNKEQLKLDTILPMLSGSNIPSKSDEPNSKDHSGKLLLTAEYPIPEMPELSISLYSGEILGIYDEEWKYSSNISDMLSGHSKNVFPIILNGQKLRFSSVRDAIKNGICIINDRIIKNGFLYNRGLIDNITLSLTGNSNGPFRIFRRSLAASECSKALQVLQCQSLMSQFSNNHMPENISKNIKMQILAARWICTDPKVIIFVNPHINFDDLTIDTFKTMIENLRKNGISIIIFSVSKTELFHTCDRIISLTEDV